MIAVVTGAAGFIGANLCRKLLGMGVNVIGIDDLSTGQLGHVEILQREASILGHSWFRFEEGDVRSPLTPQEPVRHVFHLACPASPPRYQERPLFTLETAVYGTANALEFAQRKGATLVLASTSEVYGDPLVNPQRETYWGNVNPIGPRSMYDEGKRAAEALAAAWLAEHRDDVRVVRIFNTYGPGMDPDDGRVVTNFLKAALCGEPLEVYGDGLQTRSLCFVSDMVDGLLRVSGLRGPLGDHLPPMRIEDRVFNLGNPDEMTVLDIGRRVLEIAKSESRIVHVSAVDDDPRMRRPDITRARDVLGWEPVVDVRRGLTMTSNYIKHKLLLKGVLQ